MMTKKQSFRISAMVSPLLILCGVLLSDGSAWAQSEEKTCSNKTLSGDYGFAIEGVASLGSQIGVLRGVAMTHFDGEGHLSQVDHVVVNGAPPPVEWNPGNGTYSINPDCTGTATINFNDGRSPVQLSLVVVRKGKEIHTVVNNPGTGGFYGISTGIKRD
jgi:hypothetical protein